MNGRKMGNDNLRDILIDSKFKIQTNSSFYRNTHQKLKAYKL